MYLPPHCYVFPASAAPVLCNVALVVASSAQGLAKVCGRFHNIGTHGQGNPHFDSQTHEYQTKSGHLEYVYSDGMSLELVDIMKRRRITLHVFKRL